ncbi:MAG: hypothetical protein HKM02_02920 [Pseudomonadales bacterium]|nr:hypothetical protein [Pseudomonadales bacterium]
MRNREQRLHEQIPLTAAMEVRVVWADDQRLELAAPLQGNHNDKRTAFAGSLSALLQVAGWELWQHWSNRTWGDGKMAVVAVETQLSYLKPVQSDFSVHAELPVVAELQKAANAVERHGRVRTTSHLAVRDETGIVKVTAIIQYAIYQVER